tara:strand:+ start:531 stop:773 length:243 start_codon:yes stop_codon:yes gene_type:complete
VQPLCQNVWLHPIFTSHFIKQVAICFAGIFSIPFVVFGDFFSFHICDQRKEAKERRLVRLAFNILVCLLFEIYKDFSKRM